ncbi:MAG: calcium-binding protein [Rhodospirillales bacterium]
MVYGGSGSDRIEGGDGNDSLLGHAGEDVMLGGPGNDEIDGGTENDTVDGGDDTLYGNHGDDELLGGSGADHLIGNDGLNRLEGGLGDDFYYHLASGENLVIEQSGNDTIYFADAVASDIGYTRIGEDIAFYTAADAAGGSVDAAMIVADFYTGGFGNVNAVEYLADNTGAVYSLDFLFA